MGVVGVCAGEGDSIVLFTFCSARSVALKAAHICATAGSLCHYRMARGKRWDCVMALDVAVIVFTYKLIRLVE